MNDKNDPMGEKRDAHADRYYKAVRQRDKELEIRTISQNTGFREKDIERIYAHIFINSHLFLDGQIERFDLSHDMANSWARLREGKKIYPHDITLLEHEMYELIVVENDQVPYEIAHEETEKVYNCAKEATDFNDKVNKDKK